MKNFKGTKGKWIYSPERDTHDCIIHSEFYKEEFGYISNENGGVVGSSEWIWIDEYDALLISKAPEMLDMLIRFLKISNVSKENIPESFFAEVEKLIKEATEINF